MPKPATRRATYADVLNAPPNMVAELIEGALVARRHGTPVVAALRFNIATELASSCDYVVFHLPELTFGDQILVPEVAAWRRPRLAQLPEQNVDLPAPDWACEILSPSTERLDRNAKRRIYAQAGVAFLWLLDPRTRTLEAFQLVAGKWLLVGLAEADEPVNFIPFDAISFPLSDLFPFDAPPGLKPAIEG